MRLYSSLVLFIFSGCSVDSSCFRTATCIDTTDGGQHRKVTSDAGEERDAQPPAEQTDSGTYEQVQDAQSSEPEVSLPAVDLNPGLPDEPDGSVPVEEDDDPALGLDGGTTAEQCEEPDCETTRDGGAETAEPECDADPPMCSDRTPMVCVDGLWEAQEECEVACVSGTCSSVCIPGSTTCMDGNAVICDEQAEWTLVTICEGSTPSCNNGQCECEGLICDDQCTNQSEDEDNCGRCGRSCLGEVCQDGSCSPHSLTTRTDNILYLSINGNELYFLQTNAGSLTGATIYRMSTSGSTPQAISQPTDGVFALTADSSFVYAAPQYGQDFGRMPIVGTSLEPVAGGDPGILSIESLRLNSTYVFQGSTLSSNYFHRFPKAGGERELIVDSLTLNLDDFEVDDDYLYVRSDTSVTRYSLAAGFTAGAVTSTGSGEEIADMALSSGGETLVFASNLRIASAASAGATATPLANMAGYAIVADSDAAYYLHAVDNAEDCMSGTDIYRVALAGGDPVRLSTEPGPCIREFVAGDDNLFYVSGDNRSVLTVVK